MFVGKVSRQHDKTLHTLLQESTICSRIPSPAHLSQRRLVHTLAKHSFAHAHHTSRLVLHMVPKDSTKSSVNHLYVLGRTLNPVVLNLQYSFPCA